MEIFVVGCGNVGSTIAKELVSEGHNITVIDTDEKAVRAVTENYDIMGAVGNGASLEVLKEAGIAKADLLIAVTDSDERNLLCCLIARKISNVNTIARVRHPEYGRNISLIKDDLGLSLTVNPELSAAFEIARLVKFPSAIEIDTFAKGRVELLKFEVLTDSPLVGLSMREMHQRFNSDVLVCTVEREGETFIPKGNFVINEGDKVSFVASPKKAVAFFKDMKVAMSKLRSIIIVGGGETSFYLAEMLLNAGLEVKIFEKDKKRCQELSENLPGAIIIYGDATEPGLLKEEGVDRADAFVALTNHDEENVMLSIVASKANPSIKLITKVHRTVYDDIVNSMRLGSIINPKLIAGEDVVKFVRAKQNSMGSNIETLYRLNDGKAEALEFKASEKSSVINKPLTELKIRENVIISCIIRDGTIETPKGSSVIEAGNTVIVVTTEKGFEDLDDILE